MLRGIHLRDRCTAPPFHNYPRNFSILRIWDFGEKLVNGYTRSKGYSLSVGTLGNPNYVGEKVRLAKSNNLGLTEQ
ncbi:hypothetical protein MSSAC_1814 [Methanosarcina siciliae C2J]|uniref:Uncharacterized protein n=1 Tax=Methanosarcina siciliae C2J TaxID=1434118 RepID=A0A0E3PN92_9EURY|nr:hypothetical protein [Methanosarcina siciliae]AKB36404.1 hypothetical protein MSSAC_1814 [Methanosarcina siciliae C2J]